MKIYDIDVPNELISSLLIVLVAFVINLIVKGLISRVIKIDLKKSKTDQKRRKTLLILVQRIIKYIITVIAFIGILGAFHVNTTAIITSVGALSVVIGLALQDILKDFLVGMSIILEDSYYIGDLIEINGYKGEVIDFSFKSTKLRALTGEVYIIANRLVNEITNYSKNKKTIFIDINTRYEEDIDKVRKVLDKLCINLPKKIEQIEEVKLEDGIEDLSSSSVIYRLSTRVNIKDIYVVRRKILEEVKKEFDKNNISIPYPQLEVHNNE